MHVFQNSPVPLFILNICSGRLKIKVTTEDDKMTIIELVRAIVSVVMHVHLKQLFR